MCQGLIQGCLHWVSPCFWESVFLPSVSPPLAGGNIVELGVILLGFDSCIMPVFQTLGILDSWDLAVFFDSCGLPDSYRCPWLLDSLILHSLLDLHVSRRFLFLVVFRTLFSLSDSFWPSWLSKCLHIWWNYIILSKESALLNRHIYIYD
jgi:hypothetical protein